VAPLTADSGKGICLACLAYLDYSILLFMAERTRRCLMITPPCEGGKSLNCSSVLDPAEPDFEETIAVLDSTIF